MAGTVEIFLSYAHRDKKWKDKLVEHLSLLKQQGCIAMWYDQDISAGVEWQQAIREHLDQAQIILLLISPAFMASEHCYCMEMTRALERHHTGEARVIPIILHDKGTAILSLHYHSYKIMNYFRPSPYSPGRMHHT